MTSLRKQALVLSFCFMSAVTGSAAQAASEFVNGLALDGVALDRSGGTDANTGRVGYFSDMYYDHERNQ